MAFHQRRQTGVQAMASHFSSDSTAIEEFGCKGIVGTIEPGNQWPVCRKYQMTHHATTQLPCELLTFNIRKELERFRVERDGIVVDTMLL